MVHLAASVDIRLVGVSRSNRAEGSTHRLLNVVPAVLCGPILAGVVDDHALHDVGHFVF